MPPPPRPDPPAHTMRVTMSGTIDNVPWANVFHVRNGNATTPSTATLTTFAGLFYTGWIDAFRLHVHSETHIDECRVLYQTPGGDVLGGEHVDAQQGASVGTRLPANVATCISWVVAQRYRGGHPRTYLPPPPEESTGNANSWLQSFQDVVAQGANNLHQYINGLSAGELQELHLGTVSYVLRKAWRTPPVFRDFVPGLAHVDSRIDTQRRRLGPDR